MNQHDRKHYHFARTSREAFGMPITELDEVEVPHKGDRAVVVVCIVIAVCILFGLVG